MGKQFRQERNLREYVSAKKLRNAVAKIALAHSSDGRINGDNQRGESRLSRPVKSCFGDFPPPNHIKLVPHWPGRRFLTSSSLWPEMVERMYPVPAAPAARAAAHSPAGCSRRLYPMGASIAGRDSSAPKTVARKSHRGTATA